MPGSRWTARQRERILRAAFPPPGSTLGALGLVGIGASALAAWSLADPSLSWGWSADAAATAVLFGVGAGQLVGTLFEPAVARLATERSRVRMDGAVDPLAAVLTRRERRRIASARLDPTQGRFLAGIYGGGGIGFLALWLHETPPGRADAALLGLLPILLMVLGYALIELLRWQGLVAALRNDVGDEAVLERMAPSEGERAGHGGRITDEQWAAIGSATRRAGALRLMVVLGGVVCGIEVLLAWLAWQTHAGAGLLALAACGIAGAGFLTGYAAAVARWRPLVAALRDALDGSRARRSDDVGDGPG